VPDFRMVRRALVVGGTSGIGRGVAAELLAGGTDQVLITGRDRDRARAVADELSPLGDRTAGAGLRVGWSQEALADFSYAWGRSTTARWGSGWDLVLLAAGSVARTADGQLAEAEGLRWLMGEAVNGWLRDGGVLGVITSTLTEGPVPRELAGLQSWIDAKRMVATRARDLGRHAAGVTVLDFAFHRVRDTAQWDGAPELERGFTALERQENCVLDARSAAMFVAYYMRGRHVSGRLSPTQAISRVDPHR